MRFVDACSSGVDVLNCGFWYAGDIDNFSEWNFS
jgi:hypothetical protein